MDCCEKTEMEEAMRAIASMISRSEAAQAKFAEGTAQHTLQVNRIHALRVASSLVAKALGQDNAAERYSKDDLHRALAPIASLRSKSEKAMGKLAQGTWQHTMLGRNIRALSLAATLLTTALGDARFVQESTK